MVRGRFSGGGAAEFRACCVEIASAGVMIVLAAPVLSLQFGTTDAGNDPTSQTTRRAYDLP